MLKLVKTKTIKKQSIMPRFVKIKTTSGTINYLNVNNIIQITEGVNNDAVICCYIDVFTEKCINFNKFEVSKSEFEKLKKELNLED